MAPKRKKAPPLPRLPRGARTRARLTYERLRDAYPAVTELARERGTTLEMCPTSNWLTHGVDRVADHPARRLLHDA